jgi:hypothetical protein
MRNSGIPAIRRAVIALAGRAGRHRIACALGVTAVLAALAVASPAQAFTFGQSSDARPGIAYAGGTLYVGWAGTDTGHSLNLGALAFDSSGAFNGWASVNTITGEQTYAGTGPSVTAASVPGYPGDQVLVAWSDINGRIILGHYVGTTTLSCEIALNQYSHHSPYLIGIGGTVYLAWTGTDSAQHVNILKLSSNLCSTSASGSVALADTAAAGPTLTTDGSNIFVAWPGTGSGQNLWAGQYTGSTSLAHHTCFCQYKSADDLGLTLSYNQPGGGGVLAYHGTNGHVYLLSVTMNSAGISAGGQQDGGGTSHGVDVTAVPSGSNIPSGLYDSFVDSSDGQPTFNWVGI